MAHARVKRMMSGSQLKYFAVASVVAILIPLLHDEYLTHILVLCLIFSILAIGYDLIFGYAGEPSLCQLAFFGIGAFASANLVMLFGFSVWIGLIGGMLVALIASLPIGVIALRMKGVYFFLVTVSFGEVVRLLALNPPFSDYTGGFTGLLRIPNPALVLGNFKVLFDSTESYYYLVLVILAVALVLERRLVHSKFGRALIALREDEVLAESVGINSKRYKLIAFVISAIFAGLAGGLYAHYRGYVDTSIIEWSYSVFLLAAVFVGGRSTIYGSIIGIFLLEFLQEYLRFLAEYRLIVYGLILMIAVVAMPGGLWGTIRRVMGVSRSHAA